MITVAKATSAEYYTSAAGVAAGRESYYLDAVTDGEPPGQWLGRGAAQLGLYGEIEADVMHAVYGEFRNPITDEAIGTRPAQRRPIEDRIAAALADRPEALPEEVEAIRRSVERSERKNVIGWDATFNVPKSVSVVHAAMQRSEVAARRSGDLDRAAEFGRVRIGIEEAIHEANTAAMHALEDLLTARTGGGSGAPVRWVRGQGAVIASFFQHVNRSIEPHLHQHNVVLNRMLCQDGEVRAIDGQDLLKQRFIPSAIADRVLGERLAAMGLPMQARPDGKGREVAFVAPEISWHFSGRRQQVTAALEPQVAAAQERVGHELSDAELYRLARQATLATREAKSHDGESAEELADRWYAELLSETGESLDSVADATMDAVRSGPVAPETWSPSVVVKEAIAACAERSSTWRRANLISEIELRLPTLGVDPEQVRPLLETLADQALAGDDVVQVAGVDSGEYAAPSSRLFAATGTLAAEAALRAAAVTRGRHSADAESVQAWIDAHAPTMGADQRAAVVGIASSDAALTVLVGPAGTGKSFAAGAFAHAWSELAGGRVVGLAVSEMATTVLRDDGVDDAANVDAWLAAHTRLVSGSGGERDERWRLGSRDVVMVDEASMVPTADLERIRELVEAAGARLVLTGDPRQLASVKAGGVLGLLDGRAETYTLSEVRRFAEPWERATSLQLRDGDPESLTVYDRHGRLVQQDGLDAALESAARAAVADRLDGRSVVVVAGTNDQAAAVSAQVRERLVDLGLVEAAGVFLGRDRCAAGVGDLIACRHNDYDLQVTNRAQYRVVSVTEGWGLVVAPLDGSGLVELPAEYVSADVQLAYASTVHAAQGMTVDAAHLVTEGNLDAAALYVGMTRGRIRNTAHVAVEPEAPELPAAEGASGGQTRFGGSAPRATALAVLESGLERDGEALAATVAAEHDEARRAHLATLSGLIESETRLACRARMESHLDDLVAEEILDEDVRARLATDQGSEHLSRLLRAVEQAGDDPLTTLREAVTGAGGTRRGLADAASVAQVLSYRITSRYGQAVPLPVPEADRLPSNIPSEHAVRLRQLTSATAERRAELGAETAEMAPDWAVLALGPVPDAEDPADRADWVRRAGIVAAHREATDWNDPEHALGRLPGLSVTERRADYAEAWIALGRPEIRLVEADLSTGQLLARVRAWEREQGWAPPHADEALRIAELDAERTRQDAALAEAQGRTGDAERLRADAAYLAASASRFTQLVQARAQWATRTAVTRARAEAAAAELAERGIDLGSEPDRTTAPDYLAGETATGHAQGDTVGTGGTTAVRRSGTDDARAETDDTLRPITETDVRDVDAGDDRWAALLDERSPELAVDLLAPEPAGTGNDVVDPADGDGAGEKRNAEVGSGSPAHRTVPVHAPAVVVELMLAQAGLATAVAADQASQDRAWQEEDDRERTERAADAGRRRREAAELAVDQSSVDQATDERAHGADLD